MAWDLRGLVKGNYRREFRIYKASIRLLQTFYRLEERVLESWVGQDLLSDRVFC